MTSRTHALPAGITVPPRGLAEVLLLLVAVVWGSSYGVTKSLLLHYPVFAFLALRFGLTFVLLCPLLLRRLRCPEGRAALRAGLPLGALIFVILGCETVGVTLTSASHAALLIGLCVIMTPFMEWWLLARRPAGRLFLAALLSVSGVWLLTGQGGTAEGEHVLLGNLLMLAAAVLRALVMCLTRRMTRDTPADMLVLTTVQAGVVALGALLMAVTGLVGGQGGLPLPPTDGGFWLGTLYLVGCCTLFAFFAQNWGIRHAGPSRAALLTGSEPAFGALFGAWWLGESLGAGGWLGGAVIVGASLWAAMPGRSARAT